MEEKCSNQYNRSLETQTDYIDITDEPIWKTNNKPRQYNRLKPRKESDDNKCHEDIRRIQRNLIFTTVNDEIQEAGEQNCMPLVISVNNEPSDQKNCMLLTGNYSTQLNEQKKCRSTVIDELKEHKNCMSLDNDGNNYREQETCIDSYKPVWKTNSTPRQYKKSKLKGASFLKITNVGNEKNYFLSNDGIDYSALENDVTLEPPSLNTVVNVSFPNHESIIDATDVQLAFAPSNSCNATKEAKAISENQMHHFSCKVSSVYNELEGNVITIDVRFRKPTIVGKKGKESNVIIIKPNPDDAKSNIDAIKPNSDKKRTKKTVIKPNAEGKYVCSKCSKTYNSVKGLRTHMRSVCKGCEKPYTCVWCDSQFKTKRELNVHDKTGCKPKPVSRRARRPVERFSKLCEYCGREFNYTTTFWQHLQKHQNLRRHKCPECGKGFNKASQCSGHVKFVHRKEKPWFHCSRCPHRSRLRKHIIAHENIHDLPEGAEIPTPFMCHCGKGFISNHLLTVHKYFVHKPQKCNLCGELVGSLNLLRKHKIFEHNVSSATDLKSKNNRTQGSCPICDKTCFGYQSLNYHLDAKHNISNIGSDQSLPCNMCMKTFKSFASYIRHKSFLHEDEVTESELRTMAERLSAGGIYECDRCKKQFVSKYKLRMHIYKIHSLPSSGLSCEACEISFQTRAEFYSHKYTAGHFPAEKLSCRICHKKFKNPRCLWAHKYVHATMTRISCRECGSKFKRKGDYRKHMRDKHGEDK